MHDDEEPGTEALNVFFATPLPLTVGVHDGEARRKSRSYFGVEELPPAGFAGSLLRVVCRSKAEVELGFNPGRGRRCSLSLRGNGSGNGTSAARESAGVAAYHGTEDYEGKGPVR